MRRVVRGIPAPDAPTGPDRVPLLLCGCGHTRGSHLLGIGCVGCTGPLCDPDLQPEPVVFRCGICRREFGSHRALSLHDPVHLRTREIFRSVRSDLQRAYE